MPRRIDADAETRQQVREMKQLGSTRAAIAEATGLTRYAVDRILEEDE